MRRARPVAAVVSAALCLVAAAGCVRQRLVIKSDPAGAEVLLNDKRVGVTPYDEPFLWYGAYRVTLLKPGFARLDDRVELRAPVYLWIPFDLVMELLPVPVRDTRVLSYDLTGTVPPTPPQPPWSAKDEMPRDSEATKPEAR